MSTTGSTSDSQERPGHNTAQLVNQLHQEGADHIVLLMRHSAREFAPDKHDLLNPLTDEGRALATDLGKQLPKNATVRGYTSPADRCVETADLIMQGHQDEGGPITRNRVVEALGVFYVLDQMKMYRAMQSAGGMVDFLKHWFSGNVPQDILMPPDLAASLVGGVAAEKLKGKRHDQQIDLLVSHDFTLYTLKDQLLKQSPDEYPEVNFLDGIAVFERDGRTWIQSHHLPATILDS